jgi:hypothetical protein
MSSARLELLRQTARRGKYAPLYRHLSRLSGEEWRTTFTEIEKVLGFKLPDSARIHRPWWANQGEQGGHSHALAWEMAGWKTSQVQMADEKLVFVRDYTDVELSSIWQTLVAKDDREDCQPRIMLENTDTKQSMMFRVSSQEVTSYSDFDSPSNYRPTTVVYTRIRKNDDEAWGMWMGEPLES